MINFLQSYQPDKNEGHQNPLYLTATPLLFKSEGVNHPHMKRSKLGHYVLINKSAGQLYFLKKPALNRPILYYASRRRNFRRFSNQFGFLCFENDGFFPPYQTSMK